MPLATNIPQAISELPWAGLIPIILTLVIGLMLWSSGRRILRTIFAAAGLLIGGIAGWIAVEAFALPLIPWVGALIVGIVVASIAALAYRLAVAATMAMLLAIAGGLGVWVAGELGGVDFGDGQVMIAPDDGTDAGEDDPLAGLPGDLSEFVEEALGGSDDAAESLENGSQLQASDAAERIEELREAMELDEETRAQLDQVKKVIGEIVDRARQAWLEAPAKMQWSMMVAAVAGALMGLILSTLSPVFAASVVTAVGGGLVILGSGWILATRLGAPAGPWLPEGPTMWLVWWGILTIIGLFVQWTFRRKPADNNG